MINTKVNPLVRQEVRVVLTKEQIDAGAYLEYPDGWHGILIPEKRRDYERLVYVKFFRPFLVSGKDGRLVHKTDSSCGMMIPEWILAPAPTTMN